MDWYGIHMEQSMDCSIWIPWTVPYGFHGLFHMDSILNNAFYHELKNNTCNDIFLTIVHNLFALIFNRKTL